MKTNFDYAEENVRFGSEGNLITVDSNNLKQVLNQIIGINQTDEKEFSMLGSFTVGAQHLKDLYLVMDEYIKYVQALEGVPSFEWWRENKK